MAGGGRGGGDMNLKSVCLGQAGGGWDIIRQSKKLAAVGQHEKGRDVPWRASGGGGSNDNNDSSKDNSSK
jgi:hypothetical protein